MGMCMTQQHTGKKRRKEVREAIDLQHMVKTTTIALVIIFVAGLALTTVFSVMLATGALAADSMMASMIPAIVLFVLLLLIGTRVRRWSELRTEYKDHCRKYNITKEDMRALERGEL